MNKHTFSIFSILLITLLVGTLLAACGTSNTTPAPSTGGATDGQTLMQERCSVCHSTDRIISAHKTAAEWTTTVERMIGKGAQLNATEQQTLIDYLAANYK
jgi:mono/diheme cytochrome c family protein